MNALVISLDADLARRTRLDEAMYGKGYSYNYSRAIDKNSSKEILSRLCVKNIVPCLSFGEVGCALSHLNLYNDNLSEYLFILEDDVSPNQHNPFHELILFPPLNDGEVLLLGVTSRREWLGFRRKVNRLGLECMRLDFLSFPMIKGTCAYIINDNTAKAILEVQKNNLHVADDWKYFIKSKAINSILLFELFEHDCSGNNISNLERERNQSKLKYSFLRKFGSYILLRLLRLVRVLSGGINVQNKI